MLQAFAFIYSSFPVYFLRQFALSSQHSMGSLKNENRSIHSDNVEEVHNIPMDVIIRPIPPVLEEEKVQSLMDTIKVSLLVQSTPFIVVPTIKYTVLLLRWCDVISPVEVTFPLVLCSKQNRS